MTENVYAQKIQDHRDSIEYIDRNIMEMLSNRYKHAYEIAKILKSNRIDVNDPKQDIEVVNRVKLWAIHEDLFVTVIRNIMINTERYYTRKLFPKEIYSNGSVSSGYPNMRS